MLSFKKLDNGHQAIRYDHPVWPAVVFAEAVALIWEFAPTNF